MWQHSDESKRVHRATETATTLVFFFLQYYSIQFATVEYYKRFKGFKEEFVYIDYNIRHLMV